MTKLKYEAYNKGIELNDKFIDKIEEFENNIVGAVERRIERLRLGEQDLLVKTNTITPETDMDELIENKKRLREIPQLIQDAQVELNLVNKEKEQYIEDFGKGIANGIKRDYMDEFLYNAEVLAQEYDKALTKLIAIDNQLKELEYNYNRGIGAIRSCRGVYISANRNPVIAEILHKHKLNNHSIDLRNAI